MANQKGGMSIPKMNTGGPPEGTKMMRALIGPSTIAVKGMPQGRMKGATRGKGFGPRLGGRKGMR